MQLLHTIKKSIYSPSYYTELLAKPFWDSVKYYLSFATIFSLVLTLLVSAFFMPRVATFVNIVSTNIVEHYPAELKITVDKGIVSTNVQEPYFIVMPEELKDSKTPKNLLAIDTKSGVTIDQFKSYNSAVLLTRDSIVAYGRNGKITVKPFNSKVNLIVDKPALEHWMGKARPWMAFIYPILVVLIFIACFIVHLFMLVYLLFGALLVWIVARLKSVKIGYGKAYQLGIHLMTMGIIICGIIGWVILCFGFLIDIPHLFSIILIVMAAVNLKKVEQVTTSI